MSEDVFQKGLDRALEMRPHYGFLLKTLFPIVLANSGGITADRYCRIYYDPVAIAEWELDWVAFRILVQVEHYYRLHGSRQNGRDQICWDVGTEIAITDSLAIEGIKAPPGTLFSDTFKLPESLTAEEYATALFRMCNSRRTQISDQLSEIAGVEVPEFGSAGSEELKDWEAPEDADIPTIDAMVAAMLQKQQQNQPSIPGVVQEKKSSTSFPTAMLVLIGKKRCVAWLEVVFRLALVHRTTAI